MSIRRWRRASAGRAAIPPSRLPRAYLGAALLAGLYGWAVFAMSFRHDGVIGPHYNAPGTDYMVYYEAARLMLAGKVGLLADGAAFTARLNAGFASWLTAPLPPHPWVYPPTFLLLLLPFAALPFLASYAAFLAATFAVAVAGVCRVAREGGERILWTGALLLAPATAIDVIDGQNGLLTNGLLLGGFGLLRASPVAAGLVLGVVTYKPQLTLMVPVALLALRAWRALIAAGLMAVLMVAASAAVLGVDIWRAWFAWMLGTAPGYAEWVQWGRLWGLSLFSCATLHGASPALAQAVQLGGTLLAAVATYATFRRPVGFPRQLMVLLAATVLAAPHLSPYDLVLLASTAVLLWRTEPALDSAPGLRLLALLLWWAPFFGRVGPVNSSDAVPLLAAVTIVAVLRLARAQRRVGVAPA